MALMRITSPHAHGPNSTSKSYMMGSETSFTSTLFEAGYKSCHVKSPVVQHIIRAHQMVPDWVFARGIRYGRSLYDPPETGYAPKRLFGYPLYLIVKHLKNWGRLLLSYCSFDKKNRYKAKWQLNVSRGELKQAKIRHDS